MPSHSSAPRPLRSAALDLAAALATVAVLLVALESLAVGALYPVLEDLTVGGFASRYAQLLRGGAPMLALLGGAIAIAGVGVGLWTHPGERRRRRLAVALGSGGCCLLWLLFEIRYVTGDGLGLSPGTLIAVAAALLAAATAGTGLALATDAVSRAPLWSRAAVALAAVGVATLVPGPRLELPRIEPEPSRVTDHRPAGMPVVLVTIDTLRASHMSLYGYERSTTPGLERWALEALVFERASAVRTFTAPSVASIFTGRYPVAHGVGTHPGLLDSSEETLAEAFAGNGYETAAFVINPALTDRRFGFDQGFHRWRTYPNSTRAETILADALQWIGQRPEDAPPAFVWLHLLDPHTPYLPPEPFAERFVDDELYGRHADVPMRRGSAFERWRWRTLGGRAGGGVISLRATLGADWESLDIEAERLSSPDFFVALYDAEIAYLDSVLVPFLGRLRERLPAALLALTADHGESLVERGYFFSHGGDAYQPSVHVPLALQHPTISPGRVDTPVSQVDLMPTLAALAGIPALRAEGRPLVGRDGSGGDAETLVRTGARSTDTYPIVGVRRGDWKLLARPRRLLAPLDSLLALQFRFAGPGVPRLLLRAWHLELYDLSRDPREATSLAGLAPPGREAELRRSLWSGLIGSLAVAGPGGGEAAVIDDDLRRQLRDLGYIR